MLTQHEVHAQLNRIADDVSRLPGMYPELYSRTFSERVNHWLLTATPTEAELIRRVAAEDPDYQSDIEMPVAAHVVAAAALFNPAWDVCY